MKEKDTDNDVVTDVVRGGSMPTRTMVEAPNYHPLLAPIPGVAGR